MSKVLIIGAGGVGRVVVHKCAQRTDIFSSITLASRTKAKCDAIAAEIKGVSGRDRAGRCRQRAGTGGADHSRSSRNW